MGLFGIVTGVAVTLVLGVGGLGVYAYAVDYKIDATVQETHCERNEVEVKTKQFGLEHTVKGVPPEQCAQLHKGNFVEYRIRTQRTTLYVEEGGECIYDSKTGVRCGESSGLF